MLLSDVKLLEYELLSGTMTVYLHQKQNINGKNTDKVEYKCSYEVFVEKTEKVRDFNYKLRKSKVIEE